MHLPFKHARADTQDTDTRERVDRALIALTWRSYALAALVEPPVAFAFFWVIRDDVAPASLTYWVIWSVFLYVTRALLVFAWWRRSSGAWHRVLWGRTLHGHVFAAATIWGSAAIMFLPQLSPLEQAFLIAIICGVSGGSMAELSSFKPALWSSMIALLGPLAVTFFLLVDGGIYQILGTLTLLYFAYLLNVGRSHELALRTSYVLQFERQDMIERLEETKDAAERANRAKSDFLTNMSHELRTPLNAIIGFSEVIASKALGRHDIERYVEYARNIRESGNHLLALVNGVLDLSKAEALDIELAEGDFDVVALCTSSVEMLNPVAENAGVTLTLSAGTNPRVRMHADEVRVRQIVLNLLSNAIKFTPAGGRVDIALTLEDDEGLLLRVADTGIGMSEDQVAIAMEPFSQVDSGYGKKFQGSGLGLPITQTLAEKHGGTMKIESRPGEGTTVSIAFPPERTLDLAEAA